MKTSRNGDPAEARIRHDAMPVVAEGTEFRQETPNPAVVGMKEVRAIFVNGHPMNGFIVAVSTDMIPGLEDLDAMPGPGKQSHRRYPRDPAPDDNNFHEVNLVLITTRDGISTDKRRSTNITISCGGLESVFHSTHFGLLRLEVFLNASRWIFVASSL